MKTKIQLLTLFAAVTLISGCEQKKLYYIYEGGGQGLEVTILSEEYLTAPSKLSMPTDFHSFSFSENKFFNAYHGQNSILAPFIIKMNPGIYNMLFTSGNIEDMENLTLKWKLVDQIYSADGAELILKDIDLDTPTSSDPAKNSQFKDMPWYQSTGFIDNASIASVYTTEPPYLLAAYESNVIVEAGSQSGVSQYLPTLSNNQDDMKLTKLTTFPFEMVYRPTITVNIAGIDATNVYMSISALKGGTAVIPGDDDTTPAITYEAKMTLTPNDNNTYRAEKQFNTFGLDEVVSKMFNNQETGNLIIVIEYSSASSGYDNFIEKTYEISPIEVMYGAYINIDNTMNVSIGDYHLDEENKKVLNSSKFTFDEGDKQLEKIYTAAAFATLHSNDVEWTSSNESVGTIDSKTGAFTMKSAGKTTIRASLQNDPMVYDEIYVNIQEPI